MKEFLYEILFETFTEDFLGVIVGLMAWALLLFIGFLILWGVDGLFLPNQYGKGVITNKEFIPEHTTTTWIYDANLKMSMPHTTHHDDDWVLHIQINGLVDDFSVSESYYDKVNVGDTINVKYSDGRIWSTIYIKEILN